MSSLFTTEDGDEGDVCRVVVVEGGGCGCGAHDASGLRVVRWTKKFSPEITTRRGYLAFVSVAPT